MSKILPSLCLLFIFIGLPSCTQKENKNWVQVGNIADFPASEQPYILFDEQLIVINRGGNFQLFHPWATDEHPHKPGCELAWVAHEHYFGDPCGYSRFNFEGQPLYGLAKRDLDQFAFQIVDGMLFYDPTSQIKGICRIVPDELESADFNATPPPCNP